MAYSVRHTNPNNGSINVQDTVEDVSTDIVLFGRKKLEYGEAMNSNLLHILENFACFARDVFDEFPDVTQTSTLSDTAKQILTNPVDGQLWYNKTINRMYVYDIKRQIWNKLVTKGDIAIGAGSLLSGEVVPLPISDTGETFSQTDCVWIISANNLPSGYETVTCTYDESRIITCEYTMGGSTHLAQADYFIVGIRGNINRGLFLGQTPPDDGLPEDIFIYDPPPLALSHTMFNESIGFSAGDTIGVVLKDRSIQVFVDVDDYIDIGYVDHDYIRIISDLSNTEYALSYSSNVGSYVPSDGSVEYVSTDTSTYSIGRVINFIIYGANNTDGSDEKIIGQIEFRVI